MMSRERKIFVISWHASFMFYKEKSNNNYSLDRTMIGQMAIVIALIGFNDLGRSVTPNFAIFWDLQLLWSSSLTKPDLLRFRCSSGHVISETKSVTPHFFYISDVANS